MNKQASLGLFDRGDAPHNRTETSVAAAKSQIQPALTKKRKTVYMTIASAGKTGMTCDEVELKLGWRHTTVSARINELSRREPAMIVENGRRKTSSGRSAIVWIAKVWVDE